MISANSWQINPEKAREEFRDVSQKNGGTGVKDFMDGMGLGMLADQVIVFSFIINMITKTFIETMIQLFKYSNFGGRIQMSMLRMTF